MGREFDPGDKAVAILYDQEKDRAPKIVAGGKGEVARQIIARAEEAGVHIRQDPDLVELLAKVPLGDEIPLELYQTVADLLSFVYMANKKYLEK